MADLIGFDNATYRGDAYPAFGWAARVAKTIEAIAVAAMRGSAAAA